MSAAITDTDLSQFLADMDARGAVLTLEELDQIEQAWETRRRARRCALMLLTKPVAWLREQIREDRDFALAVADARRCTEGSELEFYTVVRRLLDEAYFRATVALCERDDADKIQAEAEAQP